MTKFKIYVKMRDGSTQPFGDGEGEQIPTIGDEIRAGTVGVFRVYRRIFDADSSQYELYVERTE